MKTILVIGGAGYIGSHTVVELLKVGYEVIIVDNFSNSHPIYLNKLFKLCTDLVGKRPIFYNRDARSSLVSIFSKHKIDGIIHFAAHKSVSESIEKPLEYYDNNLNSIMTILNDCKNFNIKNIVFSSSCSLYGEVDTLPVRETTTLSQTKSPYAMTKLIGERVISDFCRAHPHHKGVALRYFNPVGAHLSGLIGEDQIMGCSNLLPIICNSVSGAEMTVYGSDYDTPDGTCIRDYIHVSDIADAHVLAIDKDIEGIYNIGTLKGHSNLEVFTAVEDFLIDNEAITNKIVCHIDVRREGDPATLIASAEKLLADTGWKPKRKLNDIIETLYDWYNSEYYRRLKMRAFSID